MSIVANNIISLLIVLLGAFGRSNPSLIRGYPRPRRLVGRRQRPCMVRVVAWKNASLFSTCYCTQAFVAGLILALGLLAVQVECTRIPEVQHLPQATSRWRT